MNKQVVSISVFRQVEWFYTISVEVEEIIYWDCGLVSDVIGVVQESPSKKQMQQWVIAIGSFETDTIIDSKKIRCSRKREEAIFVQ